MEVAQTSYISRLIINDTKDYVVDKTLTYTYTQSYKLTQTSVNSTTSCKSKCQSLVVAVVNTRSIKSFIRPYFIIKLELHSKFGQLISNKLGIMLDNIRSKQYFI